MIRVEFKPKTMELKIDGHAGYGKKGKDIVCSAVSTLFFTLGENLLQSLEMIDGTPIIKDDEGCGLICCSPKPEYAGNIALIYRTVLVGMEMIAEQYPKNVRFKVIE